MKHESLICEIRMIALAFSHSLLGVSSFCRFLRWVILAKLNMAIAPQRKIPKVFMIRRTTSRRLGREVSMIDKYKDKPVKIKNNKLKLKLVYALNLGVNLAFNVWVTPSLPWLRDSLVTTAVVTITSTALITHSMIRYLSIGRSKEATDEKSAAEHTTGNGLFVQKCELHKNSDGKETFCASPQSPGLCLKSL
jgi:hypothetical protein